MTLTARAGAWLALATVASPLAAQQVSVRLGGVRASYANAVSGSAAMATTRVAWEAPRFVGVLDGSYARFSSGWWAAQAGGSFYGIRLVSPSAGVGLRGDAEAGRISDGVWSGSFAAGPVASMLAGPLVLSAGATVGALRRIDSTTSGTVAGSLRARADLGPWTVEGAFEATRARTIGLANATLEAAYRRGPIAMSAVLGGRTGDLGGKPWLQGRVAYRATSWATLEVQAGNYPRDISGFTGGSFLSVGIWLRPWGRAAGAAGGLGSLPGLTPGSVTIESVAPGRERVTFVVHGAQQVAIAGEWNDWTPVALVRVDRERWQANVALGRGAHRFSLLVDGGRWVVPPGVPTLPDSFGGTVGLLVVD
jgi:hypothetical protein